MISLNASDHRVIIKGVQPLTEYILWVAGFTKRGAGPESVMVHVITPSKGERVAYTVKSYSLSMSYELINIRRHN